MFIPLVFIGLAIFVVGFVLGFVSAACINSGIVEAEKPASNDPCN
jgi:hypothetical protein